MLGVGTLLACCAAQTLTMGRYPTLTMARLRSENDEWGQKLKLSYQMVGDAETPHEVCLDCKFDDAGQRLPGGRPPQKNGMCGGFPNGCATIRGPTWGTTVSISLRAGGGEWSPAVSYFIDPALNDGSTHHLGAKDEL